MSQIEVSIATEATEEVVDAFSRLIPQLSTTASAPDRELIAQIISAPSNTVLLARDRSNGARIVGTLTLVMFRIPTGLRAMIEDVVVDERRRGRGVAAALTRAALDRARAAGARTVDLTSRPSRVAANRLYQKLGFVQRETNAYRFAL